MFHNLYKIESEILNVSVLMGKFLTRLFNAAGGCTVSFGWALRPPQLLRVAFKLSSFSRLPFVSSADTAYPAMFQAVKLSGYKSYTYFTVEPAMNELWNF